MLYTHINTQLRPEPDNSRSPSANGYGVALSLAANGAGYGSYVTLGTTSTSPSYGFVFNVYGVSGPSWINTASVSIAYGAAGSEKVMVTDLLVSARGGATQFNAPLYMPLYIPPNTRVAAKISWSSASALYAPTPYADITFLQDDPIADSEFSRFQKCDTYGSGAYGIGTTVDSSGSQFSLGTTTRDYGAIIVVPGGTGNIPTTIRSFIASVRTGTSGGVIIKTNAVRTSNYIAAGPYPGCPAVCNISSGTTLYAEMTVAPTALIQLDWAAYCFY